jgi:hypothetical protein
MCFTEGAGFGAPGQDSSIGFDAPEGDPGQGFRIGYDAPEERGCYGGEP